MTVDASFTAINEMHALSSFGRDHVVISGYLRKRLHEFPCFYGFSTVKVNSCVRKKIIQSTCIRVTITNLKMVHYYDFMQRLV